MLWFIPSFIGTKNEIFYAKHYKKAIGIISYFAYETVKR